MRFSPLAIALANLKSRRIAHAVEYSIPVRIPTFATTKSRRMAEHEESSPAEDEPAAVSPPATKTGDANGLKLVASARTALDKSRKGTTQLKKALRWKIHLLGDIQDLQDGYSRSFEEDILDGWVEELFRFLALKTLQNDITKPFQLAPSGPVIVAWKALLAIPPSYAAVCLAMGNDHPIDEDCDGLGVSFETDEERHLIKRLNATMRAYSRYFGEQPPALFWKGVQEPKEPHPVVQIYQTAKQLWTGVASCGNDAMETVSGCTSPKAAKAVSSAEENDILMDAENDDNVDTNPFIATE